jgi:heptosyltransferase-2
MSGGTYQALFIRFSSLGDVLLATPAVRGLKEAMPGSRITFLTKSVFAPLLEENPDIHRIVRLEDADDGGRLPGLIRLCRGLGKFHVVVDLHGNLRSRVACGSVSAQRILRYSKGALRRRLWARGWMRPEPSRPELHVIRRYMEALSPLGVDPEPTRPEIHLRREEEDAAAALLRKHGLPLSSPYGVLIPGARWPNKRWTVEGFAAIGRWLRDEMGAKPVLAGDAGERERCDAVANAMGGGALQLAGETDLRQLAALLKGALVAVGNDSGPGHIAAAVGTPLVALFGPTSEIFGFRPYGRRSRVVSHDLSCRPCSVHGGESCRRGTRVCLDEIDAAEVIEAMRDVMGQA